MEKGTFCRKHLKNDVMHQVRKSKRSPLSRPSPTLTENVYRIFALEQYKLQPQTRPLVLINTFTSLNENQTLWASSNWHTAGLMHFLSLHRVPFAPDLHLPD